MKFRIHRLAVVEIDHEVDYYERIQPGLGAVLEDEIDAAFTWIARFPEASAPWKRRLDRRVAKLDRFPFTLPYQFSIDEICILALAHMRRRPGYWQRRK